MFNIITGVNQNIDWTLPVKVLFFKPLYTLLFVFYIIIVQGYFSSNIFLRIFSSIVTGAIILWAIVLVLNRLELLALFSKPIILPSLTIVIGLFFTSIICIIFSYLLSFFILNLDFPENLLNGINVSIFFLFSLIPVFVYGAFIGSQFDC